MVDHHDPEWADAAAARFRSAGTITLSRFQEWLGRGPALRSMWEAWERGDRRGAVSAVPPEVARALILRGSLDAIRAGVQRYLDAGIDTAFLQLTTTEADPARKRQRVLDAVRALAPEAG